MDKNDLSLLKSIHTPDDVRQLTRNQLKQLAEQLRHHLIEIVSQNGGHLSSSLGTVELTIALHHVFNTPDDRLIWDVGHQTYPHKMLTGRRERMHTVRKLHGLAGFPRREESEYDTFGVGHSSTSISAALGMAIANQHQENDRKAVAIIGDGAMTAGMAFEALNHAGDLDANLLVVLNDNKMSISKNVGGLSKYLARILSGKLYSGVKSGSKKALSSMPSVLELARRAEEHMKGMIVPGTLFEELGFNYIGPIDGHDMDALVDTLKNLKQLEGPQFLHIVTQKGKGYSHAEENPCAFHGVSKFDKVTGKSHGNKPSGPSYTEIFSQWLCDMGEADNRLMAITPAMREGSGLVDFSNQFPKRYFDVGIAEQHAVTLAAGLACEGLKPVVAIYSTFLQRAYDQLIHDVALQNLPVVFAIDRAGLVGPDGATHAGSFDLSFMRCIPNMVIMAPANENECRKMLSTGFQHGGPSAIRYPRGTGPGVDIENNLDTIEIGKAEISKQGSSIAILAFGCMLSPAIEVGDKLNATIINMRFVKPLDEALLMDISQKYKLIVTIEDNAIAGGAGSGVSEFLRAHDCNTPVLQLGLPDDFYEQASREELLSRAGLDSVGILKSIQASPYYQDCKIRQTQVVS
ncbi:MAG: 1-deoxy-D-xylulose-5-phosphate synthase [Gammaproteobacteria bacterium]|nr:1-deoxy-D-xylulose-5-phosphate synthase [Gammaproteobacteria bacterium]